MIPRKLLIAGLGLTAVFGLSACVDDGYGYGGGGIGYASSGWDPYYGGFSGDPDWGWYGDYYYPGTGYYVYGRDNRRYRWNGAQQNYWRGRSQYWNNAHRDIRPMWRDFRGPGGGNNWQGGRPGGGNWQGGPGRPGGGNWQGNGGGRPGGGNPQGNGPGRPGGGNWQGNGGGQPGGGAWHGNGGGRPGGGNWHGGGGRRGGGGGRRP